MMKYQVLAWGIVMFDGVTPQEARREVSFLKGQQIPARMVAVAVGVSNKNPKAPKRPHR